MLYFRRFWLILFAILLGVYAFYKFVILKILNYIETKNNLNFDNWNPNLGRVNSIVGEIPTIAYFLLILLIIFLTTDFITGQLYRDFKSIQITHKLLRDINAESLQVVAKEENAANRWIRKGRIMRWKKKLFFAVPCLGNSSVISVIKGRCDKYLLEWLNSNFNSVFWTPIKIKNLGTLSVIYVREK